MFTLVCAECRALQGNSCGHGFFDTLAPSRDHGIPTIRRVFADAPFHGRHLIRRRHYAIHDQQWRQFWQLHR